jgi:hypothetical protein
MSAQPASTPAAQPDQRDSLNVSVWARLGKGLAIVSAIILVLWILFHLAAAKWRREYGTEMMSSPKASSTSHTVGPAVHVLKPGELKKINIRSKKIVFLPDPSGMKFRLYDRAGKPIKVPDRLGNLVEETDLLQDWGTYRPYYLAFQTLSEDKEWFIKDWY